jgi:hypothetical protein
MGDDLKKQAVAETIFKPPFSPAAISALDMAFPAHVIGKYLPLWDDIPEEFRKRGNKWTKLVDHWFALGLKNTPNTKEGLDSISVWRHLKTCMGSREPKHEHKVAGVAYLMSLWLTDDKETPV